MEPCSQGDFMYFYTLFSRPEFIIARYHHCYRRTAPHRRRLRAMYLNCMYKPPLPKRPLHPDCGSPTLVTFNHWRTAKQQSRYESLATKGNSTLSLTNLPPSSSPPLEMEEQWVGGEGGRKQETTPLWTLGAGTTVFYIDRLDKEGA